MAVTSFPVNSAQAVKLWGKKLMREALKETYVSRFMGSSKDSLIYVKDELNKSAGDQIKYSLLASHFDPLKWDARVIPLQ